MSMHFIFTYTKTTNIYKTWTKSTPCYTYVFVLNYMSFIANTDL